EARRRPVRARCLDGRAARRREAAAIRALPHHRREIVMTELGFEVPDLDDSQIEYPIVLPVLPLKDTVVFPQSMTPLPIGQERWVRLIDDVAAGARLLALVTSRDADVDSPDWDGIYKIGTVALVHKMIRVPDGSLRILVQGLDRIRVKHEMDVDPYLLG